MEESVSLASHREPRGEDHQPQGFSDLGLNTLPAERIPLESLIHHREAVEAQTPLEIAHRAFRDRRVEFMAVVRDGRVIGLCSRGQIGFVMGSRFGFALFGQNPVETLMAPNPLIVPREIPVRELLNRVMSRRDDEFHEEVLLVDAEQRLLGLIAVEALAQLQSRLASEQLDQLRRQQGALRQQNLDLFHSNNALRQSQGLYLGLFEGHTLGVALLDPSGNIHEHNRRLAELFGLDQATASIVSLATWVDEKERAAFLGLLDAHASGKSAPANREFTLHVHERGARIFRCSMGWIKETGQICVCLDDITEQRILERNMRRQEKQMLLDTLAGGVAHELNNKLTPIHGFTELLRFKLGPEDHGYIENVQRCVAEAAHIVRQLLQFARPAAPMTQSVDLRAVVEETLVMMRFLHRRTPCRIQTLLPPTPVWVLGDTGELKQVTINLILNALQALESRAQAAVTVEVRAIDDTALLIVSDNGPGIPPEIIGRIFDPFFTTKGPERGSGLGLSICFGIIRQHGGKIDVESRPEAGAQFIVSLPRESRHTLPLLLDGDLAGISSLIPPDNVRHEHVLVVEDEEVVQQLLQEMLRTQFGCRVDLAANGEEALAALERRQYSLIISDIQMPTMNGAELYRRLLQSRPEAARRFVFVTGYAGGRHLESEIAEWDVPVIFKPFTLAQLDKACRPYLRVAAATREKEPEN